MAFFKSLAKWDTKAIASIGVDQEIVDLQANARGASLVFCMDGAGYCACFFVGFAPSYYLKSFSDFRDLRTLEHIHGVIATLWITLLITQTLLIRAHRIANHMVLGYFGAVLAIAMAVSIGLLTFVSAKARISAGLQDIEVFALHVRFFWGDTTMLMSFSTFAAMGITLRRKRDTHRRLMLLATLSLMSPTIGRIAEFSIGVSNHRLTNICIALGSVDYLRHPHSGASSFGFNDRCANDFCPGSGCGFCSTSI